MIFFFISQKASDFFSFWNVETSLKWWNLIDVTTFRELQKLSEDALNRQPKDDFDIGTKLGEGSYG